MAATPPPTVGGAAPRGPRVELADIVRAQGAAYEQTHGLCHAQRRALRAIATCRTAALGGHRAVCATCGAERLTYNAYFGEREHPDRFIVNASIGRS